jgi:hypothetical protein
MEGAGRDDCLGSWGDPGDLACYTLCLCKNECEIDFPLSLN